jgi:hypothetical protein
MTRPELPYDRALKAVDTLAAVLQEIDSIERPTVLRHLFIDMGLGLPAWEYEELLDAIEAMLHQRVFSGVW